MGCGNSRSATTVASTTAPQVKPGPAASNENNNEASSPPSKTSPQNDAVETANSQGTKINSQLSNNR